MTISTNATKTEGFVEALRSSATLLVRTLDRLHFDYSETAAHELRERVALLTELDRLENKEAPIPMEHLRQRVRILQALEKTDKYPYSQMSNTVLAKRNALLKGLTSVEDETCDRYSEEAIKQLIRALEAVGVKKQEARFSKEHQERVARIHASARAAEIEADLEEVG